MWRKGTVPDLSRLSMRSVLHSVHSSSALFTQITQQPLSALKRTRAAFRDRRQKRDGRCRSAVLSREGAATSLEWKIELSWFRGRRKFNS